MVKKKKVDIDGDFVMNVSKHERNTVYCLPCTHNAAVVSGPLLDCEGAALSF